MLADREDRRGDLLNTAFPDVMGAGCPQELPEAGVIQAQRRGDGVTRLGAEGRRVQAGQGGRAGELGDGQRLLSTSVPVSEAAGRPPRACSTTRAVW